MSGYGAVLHRSPGPLAVVGYFYENWPHGKRREVYRTPVDDKTYAAAVRRIKRAGGRDQQKDAALFKAFNTTNAD